MDALEEIAAAVLYEGYVLWPYRRSARKNQQRWTFGGVYPRSFVESARSGDAWRVQTQCLVLGDDPGIDVELRCLHIVDRRVARVSETGELEFVDELQVGSQRILAWDEAVERRWRVGGLGLLARGEGSVRAEDRAAGGDAAGRAASGVANQGSTFTESLRIAAGEERETVDGGVIVRSWEALTGSCEVSIQHVGHGTRRLSVNLENTVGWAGGDRAAAQRRSFISAHFVLRVRDGAFVSLTDPPAELESQVAACQNLGLWPVLVGEEGEQSTLLVSPIILYDYPKIAPESPGLLFDSGEIDQLLILNTLTLTEAEKAEVRATDPKAREILDRAESLTAQDLSRLHGAIRDFRVLRPQDPLVEIFDTDTRLLQLERPTPHSVMVAGTEIAPGSQVRLRPHHGADVFDLALDGRQATVESIEQDYDDRVHLAVTLADDPGRDLGMDRMPGHRFFFSPDEVEPIA